MKKEKGGSKRPVRNLLAVSQRSLSGGGGWQDDLFHASRLGLDGIELLFEGEPSSHPLMSVPGIEMVRRICGEAGVGVISVLAGFFHGFPLHKVSSDTDSILPVLKRLISGCGKVGARELVLPCWGDSCIGTDSESRALIRALGSCGAEAMASGVRISILSDAPTDRLAVIMREFDSPAVSICFDTALRFPADPVREINSYGPHISSIRVHDRRADGDYVRLGEGSVEIGTIFFKLREQGFGGPCVLESEGGEDGLTRDLAYLKTLLS
jgi:sugar phosphate isomerase/epimerase